MARPPVSRAKPLSSAALHYHPNHSISHRPTAGTAALTVRSTRPARSAGAAAATQITQIYSQAPHFGVVLDAVASQFSGFYMSVELGLRTSVAAAFLNSFKI